MERSRLLALIFAAAGGLLFATVVSWDRNETALPAVRTAILPIQAPPSDPGLQAGASPKLVADLRHSDTNAPAAFSSKQVGLSRDARIDDLIRRGRYFEAYLYFEPCTDDAGPTLPSDSESVCDATASSDKPYDPRLGRALAAAVEAGDRRAYLPYAGRFRWIDQISRSGGAGGSPGSEPAQAIEASSGYRQLLVRLQAASASGEAEAGFAAAMLVWSAPGDGPEQAVAILSAIPAHLRTPAMQDALESASRLIPTTQEPTVVLISLPHFIQ